MLRKTHIPGLVPCFGVFSTLRSTCLLVELLCFHSSDSYDATLRAMRFGRCLFAAHARLYGQRAIVALCTSCLLKQSVRRWLHLIFGRLAHTGRSLCALSLAPALSPATWRPFEMYGPTTGILYAKPAIVLKNCFRVVSKRDFSSCAQPFSPLQII